MMDWLHPKRKQDPTREQLMEYAERYFYKFQYELSQGTVRDRLGHLDITVTFTVIERDRR